MKVIVTLIMILSMFILPRSMPWAEETELPPNWPWRGIVLQSCCGNINEDDLALLAKLNVNAVLLNLKVRFHAKINHLPPEEAWNQSLLWADKMLDACKEHGIVGIVRLNEIPIDPTLGITEREPGFWDSQEKLHEAVELAGKLAQHYRSRGSELGAYVILSEPVVQINGEQIRPTILPQLQQEIISEIRNYDKTRYIVVTPGPGGLPSGYEGFSPLNDGKIIYSAHMYVPHAYTHQGISDRPTGYAYPGIIKYRLWDKKKLEETLRPLREFQEKYKALVWIGEFSAVNGAKGADQYVQDLISIFDEYHWSWTYFSYKGYPLWDPSNDKAYKKRSEKYLGNLDTARWRILEKAYERNKLR